MALTIDGNVQANNNATSVSISITTSNANDVIVVVPVCNGGPVISVTASAAGLSSFTQRSTTTPGTFTVEIWYATATSPLSAVSITVTQTSSALIDVIAFGVTGADLHTVWDTNGSLPAINSSSGGVTISTSARGTMAIGATRLSSSTGSADTGFTLLRNAGFLLDEYQVYGAPISSVSLNPGGISTQMVGDAIRAAPGWGSRSFGGNDYITTGRTTDTTFKAGPFTASAWLYPTAIPSAGNASAYVAGDFMNGLELRIENGGPLTALHQFVTGDLTSTGILSTNVWTHAVFTAAGNNTAVTLTWYINGVASGTSSSYGANYFANFGTNIHIWLGGGAGGASPERWVGNFADVAIWSGVLSASEIKALSQGAHPNTIRPQSLLDWWPLDGLQSPEADLSGAGFNGTLNGTVPAFGPPYAPFTPRWPQFPMVPPTFFILMPQIVT
jgi:hypothetical protein